jgi:hypothetical protein
MAVHDRVLDLAQYRKIAATPRCTKGGSKPDAGWCMPGAGLSRRHSGKAPSERPAFQPYWGNPPYGMIGRIEETSASFEVRSAPRSYPTSNLRRSIFRRGDRRVGEIPQERPPEDTPALSHARPTTAALGVPCAKPHRPAGEAPSNRNSSTSSCRRGGNQDEGSASWPPCSAHTRHGTFKLVNGHVEVNVNVSRSRKRLGPPVARSPQARQ